MSKLTSAFGILGWILLISLELLGYVLLVALGKGPLAAVGALLILVIGALTMFLYGSSVARFHPGFLLASISFGRGQSPLLDAFASDDSLSERARVRAMKLDNAWVIGGSVLQVPIVAFLFGAPLGWSATSLAALAGIPLFLLGYTWRGVFWELNRARLEVRRD